MLPIFAIPLVFAMLILMLAVVLAFSLLAIPSVLVSALLFGNSLVLLRCELRWLNLTSVVK